MTRPLRKSPTMKVCFDTFGCRLNRAEALEEEAAYNAAGWETTKRHSDADLIVIRGCSVTARAQHDCEKHIAHLRQRYPFTRFIIQGCLPTPLKTAAGRISADKAGIPVPTRTSRAYLKVQDGCNCKCTFCIVPRFRGKSVSIPFEDVIDKAKRFTDAGYREIVVTGCNLSLYSSQGRGLAELTAELAKIGPARIRIGSIEPVAAAEETVHAMAENPSICKFLHLSVQSGSESILSAMRRPYHAKDIDKLVKNALELMPDIRLGCDIIAGFPGEMDIDHLSTRGLLMRYPFTNGHIFPYSERPGTPAADFPGVIPKPIRHERARELANVTSRALTRYAKKFIGKTVEFVIEDEKEPGGWSAEYLWCKAQGINAPAPRKSLVQMQVLSAGSDGTLKGRIVGHGG